MTRSAAALLAAALATTLTLTALSTRASAHTMGNGYLELEVVDKTARGQLDLAVRDLHDAIGLDVDLDGEVRWRELVGRRAAIERYLSTHLAIAADGVPCALHIGALGAVHRADGEHLAVALTATCAAAPAALDVDYRAIFEVDAQHRGLVRVARAGASAAAQVHLVDRPGITRLALGRADTDLVGFVRQGVWHIWIGVDHLCFLLALLLPAVLRRAPAGWQPVPRFAEVARDVFEVVTAFTLAHSITLALSALGWVRLPTRVVETAIAVSVALAAVNNLVRALDARWTVAFALGLLHGFGFSNVLTEVGLPGHHLVAALLGFNLGVELGQMAVVVAFLPLAFAARKTTGYRVMLWAASSAMALCAVRWSLERALP